MCLDCSDLVNFFLVGQPKSGTTALANFLNQHPQIHISSPKEPNFFCKDFHRESDAHSGKMIHFPIRSKSQYSACFEQRDLNQILGDASTSYAYSQEAAKEIFAYNPNAKIVFVLRNPIEFIPSLHTQYINENNESERVLRSALIKQLEAYAETSIPLKTRCPSFLYYFERAKYSRQIERYLEIFPQGNVHIILYDDLKLDNKNEYKKLIKFLGLDADFCPEFTTVHPRKRPRFFLLNKIFHMLWLKELVYKALGPQKYHSVQKKIEMLILVNETVKELDAEVTELIWGQVKEDLLITSEIINRDLIELWKP